MQTKQLDKKFLARSEEPFPLEVKRSDEFYLYDTDNKKYIDFLSGWCVGNIGWRNEHLMRIIREYNGPTYIYPNLLYRPWAQLAELLASIAPGKLTKCFRTTGGSESVDTAMQIAIAYTGRKRFLSIEGSYHGNVISTLSIGDSETVGEIENHLPDCDKIKPPLDNGTLRKIETRLKKRETAAFIMEPVICNLGVIIPEKKFMQELASLCKAYGTLLVMDEVACGFGRTGKMFASDHFGIEPDVLCLSKAITGGYAGMGATMTTEKIARKVKDKVNIYSTYGWHPLATEVALANIKYMLENKLPEHAAKLSGVFTETLSQIKFKKKARVRAAGLAIGIEFDADDYPEKIRKKCLKEGLLLVSQEQNIVLFPPLTIDEKTAREGLEILKKCV
jgi:adenosylmethionine-8-amino-7-oxononanoate aminotransferase